MHNERNCLPYKNQKPSKSLKIRPQLNHFAFWDNVCQLRFLDKKYTLGILALHQLFFLPFSVCKNIWIFMSITKKCNEVMLEKQYFIFYYIHMGMRQIFNFYFLKFSILKFSNDIIPFCIDNAL